MEDLELHLALARRVHGQVGRGPSVNRGKIAHVVVVYHITIVAIIISPWP